MPSMKISYKVPSPRPSNPPCQGDPPKVGGVDQKLGCYEECTKPDPSTGSLTGDYLHISGAMYEEPPASGATSQVTQTHNNNYYCGEGLANNENRVSVEIPGPVTVRSQHILPEYQNIILLFPALILMMMMNPP